MNGAHVDLETARAFLKLPVPREAPPEILKAAFRGKNFGFRVFVDFSIGVATGLFIGVFLALFMPDWRGPLGIAALAMFGNGVYEALLWEGRRRTVRRLLAYGRPATARLDRWIVPGFCERYRNLGPGWAPAAVQMHAIVRYYDDARVEREGTVVPIATDIDAGRLVRWSQNPEAVVHILCLPGKSDVLLADLWVEEA